MSNYTSPPSLSTSHTSAVSSAATLPADLSPASLDTLPVLTSILNRLQTNPTGTNLPPGASPATQSQTQTAAQSSPGAINQFSTIPLTTKDIPAATDELKHRLQKARAQVANLPDIQRGTDEQEEEIRELEEKIKKQRAVLEKLREMGLTFGKDAGQAVDPDEMQS